MTAAANSSAVEGPLQVPSDLWRMLSAHSKREPLPKGLDAAWQWGASLAVSMKPRTQGFLRKAKRVLEIGEQFETVSNGRLREAITELHAAFRRGRDTDDELLRALAVIREVCFRQRGEKPYLVQVAAALAMNEGCIAEMATGEGKTLAAPMPATLAAWRGRGCHVITVNDYLAKRDAEAMAPVYRFCGLRVAHIIGDTSPAERKAAYTADITYTTNKEVAADFLRDRLVLGRIQNLPQTLLSNIAAGTGGPADRLVMRGLECAIVDEADSILIDEAVTPLIISGDAPNAEQVSTYAQAAEAAAQFQRGVHFRINERYREVELTRAGREAVADLGEQLGGIWRGLRRSEELIIQAITAREIYQQGKQYVVQDDKIVIVDEYTGRLMPDRTWRDGLHQAVEAKEQLKIQPPKATFARVSFQRFFRQYKKLCGMTGTAAEARRELYQIYRCPVAIIPTNKPCIRTHQPGRVFADDECRWRAVVEEIKTVHATGRPILVGTRSVAASETLSEMLTAEGLRHEVLNAVRHAEEAQIVAGAGGKGRITVATNMAGRGTDIKLAREVRELGGLHVISAERNESRRVDRQLFGRAGRQGDPGSAASFAALTDELLARHAGLSARTLRRLAGGNGEVNGRAARAVLNKAQARAGRVALRQRKSVLKADEWLNEYLGFAGRE